MSDDTSGSPADDGTEEYPFPESQFSRAALRNTAKTQATREFVAGAGRYYEGVGSERGSYDAAQAYFVGGDGPHRELLRSFGVGTDTLDRVVALDVREETEAATRALVERYTPVDGLFVPDGFDEHEGPVWRPREPEPSGSRGRWTAEPDPADEDRTPRGDEGQYGYRPSVAAVAESAESPAWARLGPAAGGVDGSAARLTALLDGDHPDRAATALQVGEVTRLYTGAGVYDEAAEADVLRGLVSEFAEVDEASLFEEADLDDLAAALEPSEVARAMDDERLAARVDADAVVADADPDAEAYDPDRDPGAYDPSALAGVAAASDVDLAAYADEAVYEAATEDDYRGAAGVEDLLSAVDVDTLRERYPEAFERVDVVDHPNVADGAPSLLVEATDPDLVVATGGEDWSLSDEQAAAMDEAGVSYVAPREGDHARTLGDTHVDAETGGVGMAELVFPGPVPSMDEAAVFTVGETFLHEPDPATRGRFDPDGRMLAAETADPDWSDGYAEPASPGTAEEPSTDDRSPFGRLGDAIGGLLSGEDADEPEPEPEPEGETEPTHRVPGDELVGRLAGRGSVGETTRMTPENVAAMLADESLPEYVDEAAAAEYAADAGESLSTALRGRVGADGGEPAGERGGQER
jgi:hypothetical protein